MVLSRVERSWRGGLERDLEGIVVVGMGVRAYRAAGSQSLAGARFAVGVLERRLEGLTLQFLEVDAGGSAAFGAQGEPAGLWT